MSYSDEPELSSWQRVGCFANSFFGFIAIFIAGLIGFMSGCPAFAPPSCEPASVEFQNFVFPATIVLVFAGGLGLLKYFKRERN